MDLDVDHLRVLREIRHPVVRREDWLIQLDSNLLGIASRVIDRCNDPEEDRDEQTDRECHPPPISHEVSGESPLSQ